MRIFHDYDLFLFSKEGAPGYSSVLEFLKTDKAIKKIAEWEIKPKKAK